MKKIFLIILMFCLIGSLVFAKEKKKKEKDKVYEIKKGEEIVVTATMTPKALKDCTKTVNIITQEDIKSMFAVNALGILNNLPGTFVNRSGVFGRADVSIRGLGQNLRRVAVLINGKPEKMGLFGCGVSHSFPLDNIERVEVIKGPASVLYGGEALGGAVNLITRKPDEKNETELTTFYGAYNTQQYNVKQGGKFNKFDYFLTFDRRESDGFVENSGYTGYSFTGNIGYKISKDTELRFQSKYFDGKKYEPGPISSPVQDFWNDYKRGSIDLSFNKKWKNDEFFLRVYKNFGDHNFSDGWDSEDYTNGAMLRYTLRSKKGNELSFGGDIKDIGGKSFGWPKGEWDKREGALFIQNEHIFDTKWILSTGLRVHFDSIYGEEISPHAGLVYHLNNNTLFRGNISKGFRSPQLNELYIFPPANPELEPEIVWNYELGFRQKINNSIRLSGSLFHMEGSNLIRIAPSQTIPGKFIFTNTGDFSFNGGEIILRSYINKYLFGNISYSYIDFGKYTKGRPGQKVDFSLKTNLKKVYISLNGQYVTDYFAADNKNEKIPSYFTLKSRLILKFIKNLDFIVDINNIFNEKYNIYGEFPGLPTGLYPMPGRNVHFGIKLKI